MSGRSVAQPGPDEGQGAARASDKPWRALTVCLIAGFMTLLDVSIVNVALPSMERGLGASAAAISWVVSGYALTFGLALVPAGRLGDDYGRKRMFMLGLLLFVAASALCGAATDPTWLVCARLLQGIAGGLLNPQVIGMIQQLFSGRDRGKAFGLFGATVGLSTAVGPLLGGLLLQWGGMQEGWRWVFYVNLPIGAIALLAAARLLPADPGTGTGRRRMPDFIGMLLLGTGVVAVMFPLVEAEESAPGPLWWLLAAAAVLLAGFVLWERHRSVRGRTALVNLALLGVRSYSMGTVLGTVYFAGFTGIFLVLTLYFQQGLGYTPLQAGLGLLPFAIGSAISPTIGGRIVHRYGRVMVVWGIVAVVLGLAATALLTRYGGSGAPQLIAPLFVAGFGSGLVISPNQTLALGEVPTQEGGTAAGVLQTGQRIGSAVGIALAGSLFFGELSASHGDFHAAAGRGLAGSAALAGLALLVGLGDLLRSARERRRSRVRAGAEPEPGPVLSGRVTEPDETPVPGAAVTLTTAGGVQAAVATTGDDGGYRMDAPDGRYLLVTSAPDHRPVVHRVALPSVENTVDVALEPTASLGGVVHDGGRPVPGAAVTLVNTEGSVAVQTHAGPDGRYYTGGLTPGEYTLIASGFPPTRSAVRVTSGEITHDIQFPSRD